MKAVIMIAATLALSLLSCGVVEARRFKDELTNKAL
jgi:hypothetical protein